MKTPHIFVLEHENSHNFALNFGAISEGRVDVPLACILKSPWRCTCTSAPHSDDVLALWLPEFEASLL